MKKRTRIILLSLLAMLVVIQFFQIDKTNPESDPAKDFVALEQPPAEMGKLLKDACYDCHAHETEYPWYTHIQPVAWWIRGHVNGARKHLNFTVWGDYDAKRRAHKFEKMMDEVKGGEMPMKSFTWMHPEAKMTDAQRQAMVAWFESKRQGGASETLQGGGGGTMESHESGEEHEGHEGHEH